jgi:hypothetical protein
LKENIETIFTQQKTEIVETIMIAMEELLDARTPTFPTHFSKFISHMMIPLG